MICRRRSRTTNEELMLSLAMISATLYLPPLPITISYLPLSFVFCLDLVESYPLRLPSHSNTLKSFLIQYLNSLTLNSS